MARRRKNFANDHAHFRLETAYAIRKFPSALAHGYSYNLQGFDDNRERKFMIWPLSSKSSAVSTVGLAVEVSLKKGLLASLSCTKLSQLSYTKAIDIIYAEAMQCCDMLAKGGFHGTPRTPPGSATALQQSIIS